MWWAQLLNTVAVLDYITAPSNSYESIATVTVGAGGATSVVFGSIPSGYKHLQIRYTARSSDAISPDFTFIQFNADSGNNYARHYLKGDGSAASAYGQSGSGISAIFTGQITTANNSANIFGTGVIDILDYANTNKNKTVRTLGGFDANGSGIVTLSSGVWLNTSAVTSIVISYPNYAQYSSFALYGVK